MAVEPPREAVWPEGAGSEAGFVRAVLSLPEKPDTTVRFFERGDYYTVHGADARLAARELFRTRAVIRQLAGAPGGCRPGGGRARGPERRRGSAVRVGGRNGLAPPPPPRPGALPVEGRPASGDRRGAGDGGAAGGRAAVGAGAAEACSQGQGLRSVSPVGPCLFSHSGVVLRGYLGLKVSVASFFKGRDLVGAREHEVLPFSPRSRSLWNCWRALGRRSLWHPRRAE